MAEASAIKSLSDTVDALLLPIVDPATRKIAIINIVGTFVGTIKVQISTDGKTYSDATVQQVASSGATSANPTGVGCYAADLGALCVRARVIFSAYTSGAARIRATILPKDS